MHLRLSMRGDQLVVHVVDLLKLKTDTILETKTDNNKVSWVQC